MGIMKEFEEILEGPGAAAPPATAESPKPAAALPRGIRNNNPGNIDRDGTVWQGLAADQSSDPRFCIFIDPEHGIRALVEILLAYQTVHGLKTITTMISRWAPPTENDTASYIKAVSESCGIGAGTVLDMHDPNICKAIAAAIIAQENRNYRYPEAVLAAGIALAGIG